MSQPEPLWLLSRPDCHLCHEAAAELTRLGASFATIDVDRDADMARQYGEAIPVLLRPDGREVARAPLTSARLKQALRTAGQG